MFGSGLDLSSKHTITGRKINEDDHKKYIQNEWKQGKPFHVLFFWDQCGPCHATLPHWEGLVKAGLPPGTHALQVESKDKDALVQLLGPEVASHVSQITGYPTIMKLQQGKAPETYQGDRTTDAFVQWITGKGFQGGRRTRRKGSRRGKRRTRFRRR